MSTRPLYSLDGKAQKQSKPQHNSLKAGGGGNGGGRPHLNARAAQYSSESTNESSFSSFLSSYNSGPFNSLATNVKDVDVSKRNTVSDSSPTLSHGTPAYASPHEAKLKRSADDEDLMYGKKVRKTELSTETIQLSNDMDNTSRKQTAQTSHTAPPPPAYASQTDSAPEVAMLGFSRTAAAKVTQRNQEETNEDYLLEQAGLDESVFNDESLLQAAQAAPPNEQKTFTRGSRLDLSQGRPPSGQVHVVREEEACEESDGASNTHSEQKEVCLTRGHSTASTATNHNEKIKSLLKRISDIHKEITDLIE